MRAPKDIGLGNAKVTLSFAAWKEGKVVPATVEVPVVATAPRPPQPPPAQAPQGAPVAPDRRRSANNLKQIGLAMHNYLDANGRLPTAAIYSKDGEPLLSWRVAILPYLEQDALYRQFKLDEPWDSPHNKKLLNKIPAVFSITGKPGEKTHYQVFTGPDTLFTGNKGARVGDLRDGFSNTILVVEAKTAVSWTKPDDLPYDAKKPLPALGGVFEKGFNLLWADGSVQFVSMPFDEKTLRAAITPSGGETIDRNQLDRRK